jgi:hypothetical protein
MALSKEDHGDVKKAFGKALANKVNKVTRDGDTKPVMPRTVGYNSKGAPYTQEHEDALAAAMLKRAKSKNQGIKNTRKLLG